MRLSVLVLAMGCAVGEDVSTDSAEVLTEVRVVPGDAFADRVVHFLPGENAGFGADLMPDVVLGPPLGRGEFAGSLDVVSLGLEGELVLELADPPLMDGPGVDLLVFENAFVGFQEPGEVSVSQDGETWDVFPCEGEAPWTGCAGRTPVLANPNRNDLDPTNPATAGGDGFDLADLGLEQAQYVRIRDIGGGEYLANTGGFDLDAIAVVH